MNKILCLLTLSLPLVFCTSNLLGVQHGTEPWQQMMRNVSRMYPLSRPHKAWVASIQRNILSFLTVVSTPIENKNVSAECRSDMTLYNNGIQNADLWAMTMFDASAKLPEGILSGAFAFLGNFDQCLRMKKEDFNAPYSAVGNGVAFYIRSLRPSSDFEIFYVIQACMPEACTSSDIQEIFTDVIFRPLLSMGAIAVVITPKDFVYTGEDQLPLDAAAIVMIVLFSLITSMVAIATLYDLFGKNANILKGTTSEIVLSFSSARNVRSLMDMTVHPNSISCLHGLRVLSLFWVMLGHSYSNTATSITINAIDTADIYEDPWACALYNAYVSVDTFFYLSGFLMCYVFIHEIRKSNSFNVLKFYVYRYIRLTTTLAIVVGFFAALMPYIGYGPAWRFVVYPACDECKSYWWLTLLYFNNYIQVDPNSSNFVICLGTSWYLSVDMQLAWLSPLVLIPLWKWPKRTFQILLPLLIAASCFAPFTSTYINGFPMLMNARIDPDLSLRYAFEMYHVTHMRATPYLVGMAFAYFTIQMKDKKIEMKWWQVIICWGICTATCLAIIFAGAIMYSPNYVYNAVGAAFYAGFHRLAWSICLSWIIFACTRGYAGAVNSILSWPGWLPLSRLSYCAYLLHMPLVYYKAGNLKTGSYFSHFGAIHDFFAEIMIVMLWLASILHIFCEAPTLNLLRLFFKKGKAKSPEVTTKEEE